MNVFYSSVSFLVISELFDFGMIFLHLNLPGSVVQDGRDLLNLIFFPQLATYPVTYIYSVIQPFLTFLKYQNYITINSYIWNLFLDFLFWYTALLTQVPWPHCCSYFCCVVYNYLVGKFFCIALTFCFYPVFSQLKFDWNFNWNFIEFTK